MYSRFSRGYLEGGTRQKVSVHSPTLLQMPVHQERALQIEVALNRRSKASLHVGGIPCTGADEV